MTKGSFTEQTWNELCKLIQIAKTSAPNSAQDFLPASANPSCASHTISRRQQRRAKARKMMPVVKKTQGQAKADAKAAAVLKKPAAAGSAAGPDVQPLFEAQMSVLAAPPASSNAWPSNVQQTENSGASPAAIAAAAMMMAPKTAPKAPPPPATWQWPAAEVPAVAVAAAKQPPPAWRLVPGTTGAAAAVDFFEQRKLRQVWHSRRRQKVLHT